MSRYNLRTPWAIHFKLRIVIEIDSLMVCILFGEISIFHSRVMGLYSSNCRRFFICCTVNWEPLGPIHFKLRTVIGIDSLTVCILFGEISIFHSRVMERKSLQILYECWRRVYHALLAQQFIGFVLLQITLSLDIHYQTNMSTACKSNAVCILHISYILSMFNQLVKFLHENSRQFPFNRY
jgi:hypothetical protein